MSKKLNKNTAKILSGILMSSIAVSTVTNCSFADNNTSIVAEESISSRATVKTGVVTATALHVRKTSDPSSASLGGLSKGDKVEIVDTASNGWYKIIYKNGHGYVSNKYIEITSTSTNSQYTSSLTTVTYTGVTTTGLNIRSGASTSYGVVGYFSKGTKIDIVTKMSNGWYKVKFNGSSYGYVSGAYVNNVTSVSSNNTTSSNTSTSTTVKYTATVNADFLNVRSAGSVSYGVIGVVYEGETVQIVDKMSNGWSKIKYGSGYGYVNTSYLKNITAVSSNNNATVIKTGTVNTATLNVRSGASTSYTKLGTVTKGTKVEIVEVASNGWYKIKFNGSYGYVSNLYVDTNSGTQNNITVIKTGTINTATLNVRSGASTSYAKLGTVTKGTKVEIVEVASNGWYKIKFNGSYGYVSNLYVDIAGQRTNLNNFLFVGDSFTALLKNTIESKNSNVYVHAKSGSMPSYWLDKVSSMPANSKVDGVVLLIGVNGAGYESNKTDVKTLINKLSARYPNKTIYVQKIFPVGRNFTSANPYTFNQKIASLNAVIESHCKQVSNAKFIDTTKGFVDSNGYLINTYDGLHISSSYNNTFYNNILNAVKAAEK